MLVRNSFIAAVALAMALASCATSGAVGTARRAELQQDYDRAVVEYSRALKLDPGNVDARSGLQRATVRAAEAHYTRARQLAAAGKLADAVTEYQLAAQMNPAATEIQIELQSVQNQLRAQIPVNRGGKTELESLIDRTRDMAPRGLELPPATSLPDSLVLRNGSSQA